MTISHPANIPGGLGAFFASLRSRCETNQTKFTYAETLFGDDLAGIDPALWESTLLPVFNRFVGTYGFPTGLNATARLPGWADTMRNTVATRPRQSTCRRRAPSIRHLPESKMHPCGSKSPSTETSRTGRFPPSMPSKAAVGWSKQPTHFV